MTEIIAAIRTAPAAMSLAALASGWKLGVVVSMARSIALFRPSATRTSPMVTIRIAHSSLLKSRKAARIMAHVAAIR